MWGAGRMIVVFVRDPLAVGYISTIYAPFEGMEIGA